MSKTAQVTDGTDNDITEPEVVRNRPDMSKAPTPGDRQAKKKTAAQREAEAVETVEVEFDGESYTFPAGLEDADGDVVDALDSMKISHALQGLLSREDWAKFKATKPRVKQYGDLFNVYAEEIGLTDTGN